MEITKYIMFVILFVFIANITPAFIPYWTRKTENFGVSIPENFYSRPDFKKMRLQYAIVMNVINIVMLAIFLLIVNSLTDKMIVFTIVTYILSFMVVSFLYYLRFHFKMKRLKQTENWVKDKETVVIVDTSFADEKLVYSTRWFIIPLLIVIFTVAYTMFVYNDIPNEIPIHTSVSGEVTYEEKSLKSLLMLPIIQLSLIGVFIAVNFVIKHSKQQVGVQNPEISKIQNIKFRRRWSMYTIISSILMTILLSYSQMTFIYPALRPYEDIVIISFLVFFTVGTVVLAIITGQGGSRIKMDGKLQSSRIERDDDQYWKLGQFYFNKNDPSIIVEKRFGIGWTNNWAHPISWIFLLAIIALPIIIILLVM